MSSDCTSVTPPTQLHRLFGVSQTAATTSTVTTSYCCSSSRLGTGTTTVNAVTNSTYLSTEQNNNNYSLNSSINPQVKSHTFCDNNKNLNSKDKSLLRHYIRTSGTPGTAAAAAADSVSDDVFLREDFNETDDEISQINSHASSQGYSSRSSSQLSCCKRKRTNTLSADLEVESLFGSGAESVSSLDARSLSDFSGI